MGVSILQVLQHGGEGPGEGGDPEEGGGAGGPERSGGGHGHDHATGEEEGIALARLLAAASSVSLSLAPSSLLGFSEHSTTALYIEMDNVNPRENNNQFLNAQEYGIVEDFYTNNSINQKILLYQQQQQKFHRD